MSKSLKVYEREGRYYAKVKYPPHHPDKPAKGAWRNHPTGEGTLARALVVQEEMQARVLRGQRAIPEHGAVAPQALTLRELADRYLQEYRSAKIKRDLEAHRQDARTQLGWILPHLGDRVAAQLRAADIRAWLAELVKQRAPTSCNLALARLSTLYSFAQRWELLQVPNPCTHVDRFPTRPCDEHLTLQQVHQVLALQEGCPLILRFELYTGMRRGEVRGLTWERVRFDLGCIEVVTSYRRGQTKTGVDRVVPLHAELEPWLRAWRASCPPTPEGVVFPVAVRGSRGAVVGWRMGRRNDPTTEIREVLEMVGIRPRKPNHIARHSFVTLCCEAGVDSHATEMIVGHASAGSRITAGYRHLKLDFLARELAKLTLLPPAAAGTSSLEQRRRRRAATA